MDEYKFNHLDKKLANDLLVFDSDRMLLKFLYYIDENLDILYSQISDERDNPRFLDHIKTGVFIDCFNLLNDIVSYTIPYLQERDENQKWRQFFTKDDNSMGNAINGLIKIMNNLNNNWADNIDEMKSMRDALAHKTYLPSKKTGKRKRATDKINSISPEGLFDNIKQNSTHIFDMIIILSKDDFCPFCNKNLTI